MMKKAVIYLSALLLGVIACLLLIVNQLVTNHFTEENQKVTAEPGKTLPDEEKQPAPAELEVAVPEKDRMQDSPINLKNKKDAEKKTEAVGNREGYVADWVKRPDLQSNEETAGSSEARTSGQKKSDELHSGNKAAETSTEQSNKEADKRQPVIPPALPEKPEQPSFPAE